MNLEIAIPIIYFTGVIAAAFAIKVYNKHKTLLQFYDKASPFGMLLSWVGVLIILVSAIADFWGKNGKKSFNKFFNY